VLRVLVCWQAQRTPDAQPPTDDAGPPTTQGARRPSPSALEPRRIVADHAAPGPKLADPVAVAAALVAGLVNQPTTPPVQAMLDWASAGRPLYLYVPT